MKTLDTICIVLVLIGGINWGLIGFFTFDLVAAIFGGGDAILSRIIYALVGLSALYLAVALKGVRKRWSLSVREVRASDSKYAA